jgi:hypothetical protein
MSNTITQFIGKPKTFSDSPRDEVTASGWLKTLQRLKDGMGFNDGDMMWVVSSNLSGPALQWWDMNEDEFSSWDSFVKAFKKQFVLGMNMDGYWDELDCTKQETGKSVGDIAFKLQELFGVLGIKQEQFKVRTFIRALKAEVAAEVETRGPFDTFKDALAYAKKIEVIRKKYDGISSGSSVSTNSTMDSTFKQLLRGMEALNVNLVKAEGGSKAPEKEKTSQPKKDVVCFVCDTPGHYANTCPEKASGKAQDHQ